MPEPTGARTELGRIHERIDAQTKAVEAIAKDFAVFASKCGSCQERIGDLEATVNGKGGEGLKQDVAVLKSGRTDTLTVKSVAMLLGAVGALAGTIIAALAELLMRNPPAIP